MNDNAKNNATSIFASYLSKRSWATMLIASSTLSRGSAFRPTLHRPAKNLPNNHKDFFATEPTPPGVRRVDLSSYAPGPQDTDLYFDVAEFYSEFDDYIQFDNDDDFMLDKFSLEGGSAARRMLQLQRKSRHERAKRRAQASALLARQNMRSSPDALRLLAGAMSDFATSLGVGLLNAAIPLTLDPIAADSIRVAVYSAFNNATIDALESTQPCSTATGNCKQLSNFILRNAVAPAILHRLAGIISDNLIVDAELAEKAVVNDFTVLSSESYEASTHAAHLMAVAFDLH